MKIKQSRLDPQGLSINQAVNSAVLIYNLPKLLWVNKGLRKPLISMNSVKKCEYLHVFSTHFTLQLNGNEKQQEMLCRQPVRETTNIQAQLWVLFCFVYSWA